MKTITTIFSYYDALVVNLSTQAQITVSLLILFLIGISLLQFIKKPHWILATVVVILIPGGLTALKTLGSLVLVAVKLLLVRIQILL